MTRSVGLERWAMVAAALVTFAGLGAYGLWAPWELSVSPATDLALRAFGIGEWSARLPNAFGALATGVVSFTILRAAFGTRAGAIGVVVLASTPMFLLNARLSAGDALGMAAQSWVGAAAWHVGFGAPTSARWRAASVAIFVLGVAVSSAWSGVLLGPLPPVLAAVAIGRVSNSSGRRQATRWLLTILALAMVAGIASAARRDAPEPSFWLGGGAVGGSPPTWEAVLELIFHGFAPWSAALPLAVGWALRTSDPSPEPEVAARWFLIAWLAFGCVSWTVFSSRYGSAAFLGVLPLAGLIAAWLSHLADESKPHWGAAVVVVSLAVLLVRDYALFPESALRALPLENLTLPEVVRPIAGWAIVLSAFTAALVSLLVNGGSVARPDARRPLRWVQARWEAGWPTRGWLVLVGSLFSALIAFGATCYVLDIRVPTVIARAGRIAFFAPLALGLFVWGIPWVGYAHARMGTQRTLPVLLTALLAGGFVSFFLQPALSDHFSPRPVFETYAELSRGSPEPLATHRTADDAARYYTNTPVERIDDPSALLEFLRSGGQRWAIVPAPELASLDRAHREASGEHLFVADARSASLLLLAARALPDRENASFVARAVLDSEPSPEHAVNASFDGKIELLGYDLELPGASTVGAGQTFELTWYWKVLETPPRGYEVFVHIDLDAHRLNGDHEPAEGVYPTELWRAGDVIADAQMLTVPATFPPGDYTIYVGWFRGSKRLPVAEGPKAGLDRARAGTLAVR